VDPDSQFAGFIMAVVGAVVLLLLWRALFSYRTRL
jgi:uncharacterized membrane protein YeaQ/YmgE (transglycosylase-associated protein family)